MLTGEWRGIVAAVGLSVRHLRHLLGWSQHDLAERAITSQGAISRLESGHHLDVPFRTIILTLRALEQGARTASLSIVQPTRSLLDFAAGLDPSYALARIDPELGRLIRAYQSMSPPHQLALVAFVTALGAKVTRLKLTSHHQKGVPHA
jgi:transcriptional regulator with XRE-family HTH domain